MGQEYGIGGIDRAIARGKEMEEEVLRVVLRCSKAVADIYPAVTMGSS